MDSKRAVRQLNFLQKHSTDMRLAAESWASDYQILISTILSARTRDEVTIPVAEKLFRKYPTPEKLAKAKLSEVEKIIKSVNFYRNKSKNIVNCAKALVKVFNGKVPHDINELLKLPGVGRKTANVFLVEVGEHGIGVDTHVAYCSRKLGWTNNTNPHKIEEDLKKLFPKRLWNNVNATVVRFGKTHTSRKQKDDLLNKIRKIR